MSNKPLANPTTFTGQAPPWSLTQLDSNFAAIQAVINDTLTYSNYFVDQSGVANSLIVSIPSSLNVALAAGTRLDIKINNTNTGTSTLTVNAFVAQTIVNPDGSLMSSGQLRAGSIAILEYDGTNFQLLGSWVSPALQRTAAEITAGVTPVNYAYPFGDLRRYGVDLTGVTDSTTQFQNACTAVGVNGGIVYHPGGTVMINQTVKLSSNTILQGVGRASLIKANPTYIGVGGSGGSYANQTSHMIGNVNFAAVALTDTDIVVRDIAFDWGSVTIAGGGAHSISFHFVNRVTIMNVWSNAGENVTSFISCLDTSTLFCHGFNCKNAYFDDWGGTGSAHVISCTGRTTSGTTAQGIQFTGLGSYSDPGAAQNAVVAFCELYGVKNAGIASAIICNANAAGSSTARFKTFGNYVENCDLGWVCQGAIGQAQSHGDTFRNCTTGAPIFFNSDASGSPSDCRVINPTLIDCSHTVGNIAMISVIGTNNRVEGVKVMSPGGVLYTLIGYLNASSVNCYISIDKAPNGTGGLRFNNASSTGLTKDTDDLDAWPTAGALPTIASANTIAPTLGMTFVSGGTTVKTITVPPGCQNGGRITLSSTGTWVTDTTGNIGLASTPVVNRPIDFIYNPSTAKWYPTY